MSQVGNSCLKPWLTIQFFYLLSWSFILDKKYITTLLKKSKPTFVLDQELDEKLPKSTKIIQIVRWYLSGDNTYYVIILMIDQEKQSTFSGELSHYTVTLVMKEKQLEIKMLDNETLHKFYRCISQQFIDSQDRFFCAYFEFAEDIFTHLTKHFQEIVIENGLLRFNYAFGMRLQVREVVVELVKEEVDDNALAHLKISKIKDHFAAQLKQRDGQIATLSNELREIREIANEFIEYKRVGQEQFRGLSNQFRQYIKESQEKMGMLEEKIRREQYNYRKQLEEKMQKEQIYRKQLEEKIQKKQVFSQSLLEKIQKEQIYSKELEGRIQRLQDRLQKQENQTKTLEDRLQMHERNSKDIDEERLKKQEKSSKSTEEKINENERHLHYIPKAISHHPNNTHQQYYTLTNCTATSARLTRAGGGVAWYNFVNRTEVLPKQHNKYVVRIVKAVSSALMIGFCTEKGLGVLSNHGNPESVYYYSGDNGSLYLNGFQKNLSAGCGSVDGDLVECVLDSLEWRACWSKGGKVLAECAVPASMKGRPIYFSISQCSKGDAVEVSST